MHTQLPRSVFTRADLSGVLGLEIPNILSQLERTPDGFIAYKQFNIVFARPSNWLIAKGSRITENVNSNPLQECGCGINVTATVTDMSKHVDVWKVLIPYTAQIVVPLASKGAFRVNECILQEIAISALDGNDDDDEDNDDME